MTFEAASTNNQVPQHRAYLMVTRLDDGRYCVQFLKDGQRPRTSYTEHVEHVVQQARRAGNVPVRTSDAVLQRACHDHRVELIEELV